jgi:hypothetical protein
MVDGLTHAGVPKAAILPIAVLELMCLALYLIPQTRLLGALLLTGYFGGAIVTHIIGGESFLPPLMIGVWTWGGAYFCVPGLRDLLPLVKVNRGSTPATARGEGSLFPLKAESHSTADDDVPAITTGFLRFAPWINRLVLAAATLIFTMIGLRYIADPVGASAVTGVILSSGQAATTTRIGFGAFPLALAIFSFACLLSSRRLLVGVTLVATVITTAILVRLFSIAADGVVPQSLRLFVPETAILLLSVTGLILGTARLKHQSRRVA